MVIDPIGAGGSAAKSDLTQERMEVPEVESVPPVQGTRNYPGTELNTQSGNQDKERGRSLLGERSMGEGGDPSNVREEVEKARRELNEMLLKVNQRLSFRLHEGSERMTVQIIDNKTNEVVREIPPEKFLDTIAKMREFIGLLFDDWV